MSDSGPGRGGPGNQSGRPRVNLDTPTVVGALLIAVAVGVIILVNYVVPYWNSSSEGSDTGFSCQTNLDCIANETCSEETGTCHKPATDNPFPWGAIWGGLGVLAAIAVVVAALFIGRADDKKGAFNNVSIRVVAGVVALAAIGGIAYYAFNAAGPSCPVEPKTCPTGQTPVCNTSTDFNWECKARVSPCGEFPPTCQNNETPTCNPSTLTWQCPDVTQVCTPNPPPDFFCPGSDADKNYVARCDAGTGNIWTCEPSCFSSNPGISCSGNTHPGCSADTEHEWKCVPNFSNVCGTTVKPNCDGAQCVDSNNGWTWKCPGQLTRQDIIQTKVLQCKRVDRSTPTGVDGQVDVCFTDSSFNVPIYPTIGADCEGSNSTFLLPLNETNLINNPIGNMSADGTQFIPKNEGYIYYQPEAESPRQCILSFDASHHCQNGGIFDQNVDGISREGTCLCPSGWKGPLCQYSNQTTCNGGQVDDQGNCSNCPVGQVGDKCQYTNARCNNRGQVQSDGVCVCDEGFDGPFCQYSDANCGNGVADFNGNCVCNPGFTDCRKGGAGPDANNILKCACRTNTSDCYVTAQSSRCMNNRAPCGPNSYQNCVSNSSNF